ncbi:phage tail protein [Propionispora vibrioides]|nr:phage tail protein [Propionispora vibrioides]
MKKEVLGYVGFPNKYLYYYRGGIYMSYNSSLPADVNVTVSTADIRENFRALKEDKIVDAATAVIADSAAKLSTPRTIALQGDATGSAIFDGSADVAISVDVLSADTAAQCTGNSATATKLETARNINGVAFDGTKDINIPCSGVPVGTIIAWPSSTLPGGDDARKWLECNGQSTEGYPELAAVVGSYVPDYRGYFLRGVGGNSAALGVAQGDAIRNIVGKIDASSSAADRQAFGEIDTGKVITGPFQGIYSNTYSTAESSGIFSHMTGFSFDASLAVPTAVENRPINKSVYYLIRAK